VSGAGGEPLLPLFMQGIVARFAPVALLVKRRVQHPQDDMKKAHVDVKLSRFHSCHDSGIKYAY